MFVLALGYLVTLVLLFIGRYSKIDDDKRGIINRVAYNVNLFLSISIVSHELWKNRDEKSRASITSLIATGLTVATGVVFALNIAHKDVQKDAIFGVSLSVSVIGMMLALDIESFLSFPQWNLS